jgi:hypothetical protein
MQESYMKNIFITIITAAFVLVLPTNVAAQQKMSIGAGADVMIPIGSFGDKWSTGFGGTAEFDYMVKPTLSVTGKLGYLTWSAKDLPSGVSATYSGVPFLVGGKYYFRFMSEAPVRGYGHLELGMMFGSVSASGSRLVVSESKTDFTIVPSLGLEIPAGTNGSVDISMRYFDIASKGSLGLRAGYIMEI